MGLEPPANSVPDQNEVEDCEGDRDDPPVSDQPVVLAGFLPVRSPGEQLGERNTCRPAGDAEAAEQHQPAHDGVSSNLHGKPLGSKRAPLGALEAHTDLPAGNLDPRELTTARTAFAERNVWRVGDPPAGGDSLSKLDSVSRNARDMRRFTTLICSLCRSPAHAGISGRGDSHNYVA